MIGNTYSTIYGAVSAVPIFLIWTYACWTVIILGAVFAASLADWRRDREFIGVQDLTPQTSLAAAVSALALLARKARRGGGTIDQEHLAEVIPLGARDTLVDALHSHGYLVETANDGIALARDLHHTTLADLARDLGLALGTRPDMSEMPETLGSLLARLGKAEDEILGRPLADLIARRVDDVGNPDAAIRLSSPAG